LVGAGERSQRRQSGL